jgi:hypothetical protein
MTRRLFWAFLGVGLGAGIALIAARRLRATAEAFTPAGLRDLAEQAADAARSTFAQIRANAAVREEELRAALLPDQDPDQGGPQGPGSGYAPRPSAFSTRRPGPARTPDDELTFDF